MQMQVRMAGECHAGLSSVFGGRKFRPASIP